MSTGPSGIDGWHGGPEPRMLPGIRQASPEEADRNLAAFGSHARLLYGGEESYLCRACLGVFGVTCPRCHRPSSDHHPATGQFRAERPLATSYARGRPWAIVRCSDCGERFRLALR